MPPANLGVLQRVPPAQILHSVRCTHNKTHEKALKNRPDVASLFQSNFTADIVDVWWDTSWKDNYWLVLECQISKDRLQINCIINIGFWKVYQTIIRKSHEFMLDFTHVEVLYHNGVFSCFGIQVRSWEREGGGDFWPNSMQPADSQLW